MDIIEIRKRNIGIFKNTKELYESIPDLISSVATSIKEQRMISEKEELFACSQKAMPKPNDKKAKVIVSEKRSFEAAEPYAKAGKKVCVLNFADWITPGGWVLKGAPAQEESLCRCSTLYPCISAPSMMEEFYLPHSERKKDPLYKIHNDDLIYTPKVTVFKTDSDYPQFLPQEEWYQVDVITCAAPNLKVKDSNQADTAKGPELDIKELKEILQSRIRRIFQAPLYYNNANYDVLILGGFGCGAFSNPPELVAQVFNEEVKRFCRHFDTIEFPIFHREYEYKNFDAFCKYIKQP